MVEYLKVNRLLIAVFLFTSDVMNVCALIALKRSKTLSPNIRVFSMNLIASNLISCNAGLALYLVGVELTSATMDNTCYYKLFSQFLIMNTVLTTLFSITSMAVDRLAAIMFPMKYLEFLCSKRIRQVCIGIWMLSVLISLGHHIENKNRIFSCVKAEYHSNNISMGIANDNLKVIGTTNFVIIIVNIVVFLALFSYLLKKNHNQRLYSISMLRKLMVIFVAYAALYGPFCISTIIVGLKLDVTSELKSYIRISIVMVSFAYVVDPFLYAWRYKMCRLHMLRILCFFRKAYVDQITAAINEHYCTYNMRADPKPTTCDT